MIDLTQLTAYESDAEVKLPLYSEGHAVALGDLIAALEEQKDRHGAAMTGDWIKASAEEIALKWGHIDRESGTAAQVEQDAYAGHARMVEMLVAIIEKHYLEQES